MALLTFSAIFASPAFPRDFRLLEAEEVSFEYLRLNPLNRDPYTPEYTGYWREQVALQWDLRLLEYGYWNNRVHTETTEPSGRVTTVGWQWEAGIRLGSRLDLYHYHHSRHVMEQKPDERFENSGNQFPVENAYGVRVRIIGDRK